MEFYSSRWYNSMFYDPLLTNSNKYDKLATSNFKSLFLYNSCKNIIHLITIFCREHEMSLNLHTHLQQERTYAVFDEDTADTAKTKTK